MRKAFARGPIAIAISIGASAFTHVAFTPQRRAVAADIIAEVPGPIARASTTNAPAIIASADAGNLGAVTFGLNLAAKAPQTLAFTAVNIN